MALGGGCARRAEVLVACVFLQVVCLSSVVAGSNGTALVLPLHRGARTPRDANRARRTIPSEDAKMPGLPSAEYIVELSFGSPNPSTLWCVVDTGSSNLAVAANRDAGASRWYDLSQSTTAVKQGVDFEVKYVSSYWEAEIVTDRVAFVGTTEMNDAHAPFGAIYNSHKFFLHNSAGDTPFDGILGLAYRSIAQPSGDSVEPFFDLLVRQHNVKDVFSLEFCDHNAVVGNGTLVLGGFPPVTSIGDTTLFTPIVTEEWYMVEVTGMAVGGTKLDINCGEYNSPGLSIVDSGTTDLLVPANVHTAIVKLLQPVFEQHFRGTPAEWQAFFGGSSKSPLLMDDSYTASLPELSLSLASTVAGQQFDLTIPPHMYMRAVGNHQSGKVYREFSILPQCQPYTGMTIGLVLMANYVVIFDRENRRIGFANHRCTSPAPLKDPPTLTSVYPRTEESCDPDPSVKCASTSKKQNLQWVIWTGVGVGAFAVVAIFVIVLRLDQKFLSWLKERRQEDSMGMRQRLSFDDSTSSEPDDEMLDYDYGAVPVFKTPYNNLNPGDATDA
eukprot:m.32173 g.32173  ORF g.32173 m.32173 type:complete len:555 (+) comp9967_c0_seq1:215-1879(+)